MEATVSSGQSPSSNQCARTSSQTGAESRRAESREALTLSLGRNWVERVDGSVEMLGATASAEVRRGDRFVIETPGGGGFGRREE